jgi:hypothetical protein
MKKMKWTLMSLAIIISVCGAFVTRPKFDCTQLTQYYQTGGTYMPAGQYGITYICEAGSTTCTFYTLNGGISYTPCQLGTYTPGGLTTKDPAVKTSLSTTSH